MIKFFKNNEQIIVNSHTPYTQITQILNEIKSSFAKEKNKLNLIRMTKISLSFSYMIGIFASVFTGIITDGPTMLLGMIGFFPVLVYLLSIGDSLSVKDTQLILTNMRSDDPEQYYSNAIFATYEPNLSTVMYQNNDMKLIYSNGCYFCQKESEIFFIKSSVNAYAIENKIIDSIISQWPQQQKSITQACQLLSDALIQNKPLFSNEYLNSYLSNDPSSNRDGKRRLYSITIGMNDPSTLIEVLSNYTPQISFLDIKILLRLLYWGESIAIEKWIHFIRNKESNTISDSTLSENIKESAIQDSMNSDINALTDRIKNLKGFNSQLNSHIVNIINQ